MEKRAYPRFRITQVVSYQSGGFGEENFLSAEVVNLSVGGIGLLVKTALDPLSELFLMFSLPTPEGDYMVRCEGYVAHVTREPEGRYVVGAKFVDLDPEAKKKLEAYLVELEAGEKGTAPKD